MQPLSEKAKGKQRAVEFPDSRPCSVPVALPATCDLVIRFPEGTPDLRVVVTEHDTLKDVKDMIRCERPQLSNKRLRFIHSGRLLADTLVLHAWLVELDEKRKQSVEDDSGPPNSETTWMHCSVGREIEDGEDEEGKEQKAQLQPARGFDRLASVGFSEADIANFRQQFHSQSASNYLDTDFETEEEYDEHARALEEEWIDSLDSANSASLSQNSSNNPAFWQGCLLGFFFPLIPFFFFRNNHPPAVFWENGASSEPTGNVIFSKLMQMGLVVGFLINLLFGTWRFLLDSS
ncbi:DUF2407 ubiquitin-like domain-containing protein [Mycena galopus ATCC 62051]|nr:DUF2407 ubiquitin-like domain-containing protein [Mycena galopus ATCC 62051]